MQTIACHEPLLEASLGDALFEFVDAGAGLGACDDYVLGRDVELLFDGCCLAGLLGTAELVGLGEADDKVELVALQVVDHVMVELTGVVANIHQRYNQVKAALRVEEVADKFCPAVALGLGTASETVARQVDEVHVVSLKEVDVARLARRARNLDQVFAAKKLVHDRRLAHVGEADAAPLGAGGIGNLRNLAIAGNELGKLGVNGIGHGHSLVVGSYKTGVLLRGGDTTNDVKRDAARGTGVLIQIELALTKRVICLVTIIADSAQH